MSIENNDKSSEGFASRWSRRKLETRADKDVDNQSAEPEKPAIPLNTVIPDATTGKMHTGVEADRLKLEADTADERVLTDEDMPDTELLDAKSDYSGFLSPGVSEKLRKVALRKLFYGSSFNIRDGLDDYDEDFTNFEPLGDIITSDMKHREEVKEKRRQEELAKAEKEAAETAENEADEPAELTEAEGIEEESTEETAIAQDPETEDGLAELSVEDPKEPNTENT